MNPSPPRLDGQTAQAVRDALGDASDVLEGDTRRAYNRLLWHRRREQYNEARRKARAAQPDTQCDRCGLEMRPQSLWKHRKYNCPSEG